MEVKLSDFIWTKDNALTVDFCQHVIDKFDNDDRKRPGIVQSSAGGDKVVNTNVKKSVDLPLNSFLEDWGDEDQVFFNSISKNLYFYWEHLESFHAYLNPIETSTKVQDKGYQIKRYETDGYYNWHHDYSVEDDYGARIVTFIWYLNDVDESGFTEFVDGTIIKPKTGRVLIFPATWAFLHRGLPPKSGKKYITTGWLYGK